MTAIATQRPTAPSHAKRNLAILGVLLVVGWAVATIGVDPDWSFTTSIFSSRFFG